jgi:hypothetical protein
MELKEDHLMEGYRQVDKNTMYWVSCLPTMGNDPYNAIKAKDVAQEYIYTIFCMCSMEVWGHDSRD